MISAPGIQPLHVEIFAIKTIVYPENIKRLSNAVF
jgi:hypothetical protein